MLGSCAHATPESFSAGLEAFDGTVTQVAKLVAAFSDPSDLAANGLWLGGEKYMLLAGEPGAVVRGRGKDVKTRGVTIKKTNTALVAGVYDEGVQPADCNMVVENLGDYLAGQGI